MKVPGVVGLVLLVAAGGGTPASANWFANSYLGINRNIGSAPNPTPEQLRQEGFGVHPVASNVDNANIEYIPKPIPPWPYYQASCNCQGFTPSWYNQPYAYSWAYRPYG